MTNGVPSEASDQELSEQLLSDCKQIIQQIADALPSPEDRTRFAKNLIQAALDEQGGLSETLRLELSQASI
jgi:hypothetical protein